jgi:hypothetical protein
MKLEALFLKIGLSFLSYDRIKPKFVTEVLLIGGIDCSSWQFSKRGRRLITFETVLKVALKNLLIICGRKWMMRMERIIEHIKASKFVLPIRLLHIGIQRYNLRTFIGILYTKERYLNQ